MTGTPAVEEEFGSTRQFAEHRVFSPARARMVGSFVPRQRQGAARSPSGLRVGESGFAWAVQNLGGNWYGRRVAFDAFVEVDESAIRAAEQDGRGPRFAFAGSP